MQVRVSYCIDLHHTVLRRSPLIDATSIVNDLHRTVFNTVNTFATLYTAPATAYANASSIIFVATVSLAATTTTKTREATTLKQRISLIKAERLHASSSSNTQLANRLTRAAAILSQRIARRCHVTTKSADCKRWSATQLAY